MSDLSIRSLWVRLAAPHLYSCETSELTSLIRQGDQKASCALYDRYKRPLVRFAYYLSENEKRAQKLVQQGFLDFFRGQIKREIAQEALLGPKTWIYRHMIEAYTSGFPKEESPAPQRLDALSGPEVLAQKPAQHLQAVLTEMSPRPRAQFLLWALSGLTTEEQAWVFNLRPSAWQREWEKACSSALFWSEVVERDQNSRHGLEGGLDD